ncbi:hypothetical protein GF312_21455 [Candidatus Poribacteria bacterium]|nr:hypothetical protein [Candidatus Poribacteria bacterium]
MVDVFQDIDRARVYSYFSLFSPSGNSYKVSFNKPKTVFLDYISVSDSRKYVYGDMSLIQKNGLILEISNPDIANPQLLCSELYVKLEGNIEINSNSELISHFPFDLDECYYFSDGQYFFLGDIKQGKSLRWDNQGNIPGISSIKDEGKQIFINSMRRNLSQRISGRGIIGWMKDSALRSLAGINPGQTYRKTGSSLVIIHL